MWRKYVGKDLATNRSATPSISFGRTCTIPSKYTNRETEKTTKTGDKEKRRNQKKRALTKPPGMADAGSERGPRRTKGTLEALPQCLSQELSAGFLS